MAEPALIERLKERTGPIRQAVRGPAYNHPLSWYAKPNGDVVLLQGDPQNRAYYEDKGYAVLRPDEVREWEREVRPQVMAELRLKAGLITTIRRVGARFPAVQIVADLDEMTVPELEAMVDDLGKATGTPVKVIRGRDGAPVPTPEERELAAIGSGDELTSKLERAAAEGRSKR